MKPRILLVEGSLEGQSELGRALEDAGFEVVVAPDGFFATTLLERNRPAMLLTGTELPDMGALELMQILADDPHLADLRRVLLPRAADGEVPQELAAAFDLVLPPGVAPAHLAAILRRSLATPSLTSPAPAPSLKGTLDALEFASLAQLLGNAELTGVLRLTFEPGEGLIYFDRGQVVHAVFGEARGMEAFVAVTRNAGATAGAAFRFEKLGTAEVFCLPRSLGTSIHKLLLAAAVELDEASPRAAAGRSGRSIGG